MWNVTLCRQLIFEDAIEAESEEEAVEIAMERAYDGLEPSGVFNSGIEALVDSREWEDDEEGVEWALD